MLSGGQLRLIWFGERLIMFCSGGQLRLIWFGERLIMFCSGGQLRLIWFDGVVNLAIPWLM